MVILTIPVDFWRKRKSFFLPSMGKGHPQHRVLAAVNAANICVKVKIDSLPVKAALPVFVAAQQQDRHNKRLQGLAQTVWDTKIVAAAALGSHSLLVVFG